MGLSEEYLHERQAEVEAAEIAQVAVDAATAEAWADEWVDDSEFLGMPVEAVTDDAPFSMVRGDRPFWSTANVAGLRHDKTAWLDAGATTQGAVEIVSKYYRTADYAGVPRNAILVPVPSTTGKNILPDALARRISKDFGQPIETRRTAVATAQREAKNKRTFFDKESDPVRFEPAQDVIADLKGKDVFLTEDVHNTGESWIAFARMLIDNGVNVRGVATLASTEQRMSSARDIERLSEKVAAHVGKTVDEVLAAMQSLFDGTFKQLLNKAEAEVTPSAAKAHQLLDIASSGRRAGAYSNPLGNRGSQQRGILGVGGQERQGEFGFSLIGIPQLSQDFLIRRSHKRSGGEAYPEIC